MGFADLGLGEDVLRAVSDAGYDNPTPIQEKAIPFVLMSRDILGCAQTGTGKTASFTLPMIDILAHGRAKARMPRTLILEPTRELAAQVAENFDKYGKYHKLNKVLLIGGESMQEQMKVMEKGVDVLIATPGRLLDMFERGGLLLRDVKILVIDEADRMLDMGFIPDVERIVSLLPPLRQTLFFSATMPPEIKRLADAFLSNPKEISVAAPSSAAETVRQALIVVDHVEAARSGRGGPSGGRSGGRSGGGRGGPRGGSTSGHKEKRAALRALIAQEDVRTAFIFCNRKRDVGVTYRSLVKHGFSVGQLHGDMSQSERTQMLHAFKNGEVKLLVCSDVAARGIDVSDLSHVFNFDVPTHAEDYIHRIGRTGRAGKEGVAFTLAVSDESKYIDAIQRLLKKPIERLDVVGLVSGTLKEGVGRPKASSNKSPKTPAPEAPASEPEVTEDNETGEVRVPETQNADEKPKRSRRKPSDKPADAADEGKAKAPARKAAKPAKKAEDKPRGRGRGRDRDTDNNQVVGLGDHVPAFLLRAVKLDN
ncbi:DEAD/DEAH box helicase [Magnetospira sp. QH-2]|uniref:DEAD/DEAH box helicase n=1 Tax=Magnetospira sp. (strain QH-2) TaxID=1288970 RepID=UPI0003E80CA9|nr:DEAD/DEAH box helicase [Magnetospira sp. QH-2]CCQ74396.1 Putative ATP-dependent RNA helicase [Magnetospira sp. QH-2]